MLTDAAVTVVVIPNCWWVFLFRVMHAIRHVPALLQANTYRRSTLNPRYIASVPERGRISIGVRLCIVNSIRETDIPLSTVSQQITNEKQFELIAIIPDSDRWIDMNSM